MNKIIQADKAVDGIKDSAINAADGMEKLETSTVSASERISEKITGVSDKMGDMGKKLTKGVTVPLVALGTGAVVAAKKLDDGYSIIRKSTGETGAAFEGLKDSFKEVFKEGPESATEVATALSNLNVATGAVGKELEGFTATALAYARIADADVGETTKNLGRLMNALEVDVSEMPLVMDKLTKSAQMSGINVNDLTNYIIEAGPAFEEMGFDLDRSIALFSKFEKEGANPREVLSSLNIVMNRMAEDGATNAEEAFNSLLAQIQAAPDILAATSIASEAFGSRVGAKVAEDIRDGKFEVDDWVAALQTAEGTVKDTARETMSFSDRLSEFGNSATVAFEPFGISLLDSLESVFNALTPILNVIGGIAEGFAKLNPNVQTGIIAMFGIAAAAGPVMSLSSNVLSLTASIWRVIPAVWSFTAALLANPITWVVVAIVALIGAIYLLWKNWDTVSAWFGEKFDWIKEKAGSLFDWFKGLVAKMSEIGKNIISGLINGIKSKATALFSTVTDIAAGVSGKFKSFFGISSPSKLMMEYGVNIQEGLQHGMEEQPSEIPIPSVTSTNHARSNTINANIDVYVNGGSKEVAQDIKRELKNVFNELANDFFADVSIKVGV